MNMYLKGSSAQLNTGAQAQEDLFHTQGAERRDRGFVLKGRILAPLCSSARKKADLALHHAQLAIELFVCLFYSRFMSPTPKGYVDFLQKKPAAAPACEPQQKKSSAPSVRCAPFSGYGSPLQS
jgi:hypothetical protein